MNSSFVQRVARRAATPVSLNELFAFGRDASTNPVRRLQNARFLHGELQTRIAQRLVELDALPIGLTETTYVKSIAGWYLDYFEKLASLPFPETEADEEEFTQVLNFVLQDNAEVIETMSRGVIEVRSKRQGFSRAEQVQIDSALNRFYIARIGLRFLIEHHVTSRNSHPGFSGIIQSDCRPIEYAQIAAEDTTGLCEYHLGDTPRFVYRQVGEGLGERDDVSFTYVPGHLTYMLCEVLKNAARATMEHHADKPGEPPPIHVTVVNGRNDVTIRVSDEGGGIKRAHLEPMWSYLHSTAKDPGLASGGERPRSALAGFGVGLPLSRLYARYFGGDLDIKSLEGHGTDVFLHLSRLGNNCENLPKGVLNSPASADSTIRRGASMLFMSEQGPTKEDLLIG